jgi:hypothetical protein
MQVHYYKIRSSSDMGDLDLLSRSPEVIELLMVSAYYLKK